MPNLRDDPTISNASELWRRIIPEWVVPDENDGGYRLSSKAFQNFGHDGAMSVQLAEEMQLRGLAPGDALKRHPSCSLASITAGLARRCEQAVLRDPLPDGPAHALVDGKKTKSVRRKFAAATKWIVRPAT